MKSKDVLLHSERRSKEPVTSKKPDISHLDFCGLYASNDEEVWLIVETADHFVKDKTNAARFMH